MANTQNIPWKRLFAEAAAIVGSILLAFAIDAWWENRSERETEQWLMERLRADFREIRSALDIVEEEHQKASDACIALLKMSVSGGPLPISSEVDTMMLYVRNPKLMNENRRQKLQAFILSGAYHTPRCAAILRVWLQLTGC